MKELESLVAAAKTGDRDAYGQIVRRFQDMAYGCAYSVLGDFHLAEDAAQEAFIEAHHNLAKLSDAAAFPGWFRRIVQYRCSRMRRGRRLPTVAIDDAAAMSAGGASPGRAAEDREMKDKVLDALNSLPTAQREVTTLFYINGYSHKDIAEFIEAPVTTVKSRLHASRKQLKERMTKMMKQTFDEHKLPDDFAGKIIEGVPVLAWDTTGNTTYIAAVSAALATTDRPFDYDSLMVYTGLAFRLRYVRRKDGRGWCGVGPIGQFEEEVEALCLATGCDQPWTTEIADRKQRIIAAIDAGNSPIGYIKGDSGVIYGYEDDGDTVLVRCYDLGEGFHRLPVEEVVTHASPDEQGPHFLHPVGDPMSPRDALVQGLRMGVSNWRRGRMPGEEWQPWREKGKWEYCFGDSAYGKWIEDLKGAGALTEEQRNTLRRCYVFTAYTLYDARLAGGRFLAANARLLGEGARGRLEAAAKLYGKLGRSIQDLRDTGAGFVGTTRGPHLDPASWDWPAQARQSEIQALTEAHELDAAAIVEIEGALAAMG